MEADYPARHQNKDRREAMSAIIKFVATAKPFFQAADDEKSVVANREIRVFGPSSICEPGQRFWKLSRTCSLSKVRDHRSLHSRAVPGARVRWDSQLFCRIIASASKRRRRAGRGEGHKRRCVVCVRTSASRVRGEAFRLYASCRLGRRAKRGFMAITEIFLSERR